MESFLNSFFASAEARTSPVPVDALICLPTIAQPDLFSWTLQDRRFRVVKLMNHMVLGRYDCPKGIYMPSVEY